MKKVISREYKVMLRANRFAGDQRALAKAASSFWRDFTEAVSDIVRGSHGAFGKVGRRRLVTFLDTADHRLNKNRYILRDRRDVRGGNREMTLKFRHEDRHVTQNRVMTPARTKKARTKFEEDIKPAFVSLYSYSTTIPVAAKFSATTLGDLRRMFPDIKERLEEFQKDAELLPVREFTARELVLTGPTIRLGKRPKVEAECALIVWYDDARRPDAPVAVEFSYRYGNKRERYSGMTSRRAFEVFDRLQKKLRQWVDPRSRTKTRLVYS